MALRVLKHRAMRSHFHSTEELQQVATRLFPKVQRIARAYAARLPPEVELEDLVQTGAVGLLSALNAWDPAHGGSLEAYAEPRIRGAIQDALRAEDPLTRDERKDVRALEAAGRRFVATMGRPPEEHELAEASGLSLERVQMLRIRAEALVAPAKQCGDHDEARDPIAELEDTRHEEALELVALAETRERLIEAIGGLPERQRLVLSLYYVEELALKEIADLLAVTESRVCQIHREALKKLKTVLGHR